MRSHLLLGCLSLFLNIVTVKPHVVIMSVRNKALVGVLTGAINLENLADLQQRINDLVEHLRKGAIGIPSINPIPASKLTSTTPLPSTKTHKNEKCNNCTHQLVRYLKPYPETLKAFATEFLINTLEGSYDKGISVVSSLFAELNKVPTKVYSEIIERKLEKTYSRLHHERLLALIARNKNISQVVSGINGLFGKIKAAGDLNNSIILNLASNLSELQNRHKLASLHPTEKNTFNNIVDSLPVCARNLFFEPEICLWHVQSNRFKFNTQFRASRQNDAFLFQLNFDFETNTMCIYANGKFTKHNESGHEVYIGHRASLDQKLWNAELAGDNCYLKNVYYQEYLFSDGLEYIRTRKDTDSLWQIRKC